MADVTPLKSLKGKFQYAVGENDEQKEDLLWDSIEKHPEYRGINQSPFRQADTNYG